MTLAGYGRDNAGRLTSLENLKADETVIASFEYTLAGSGNRTGVMQDVPLTAAPGLGTTAFTYNTLKNRIESVGGLAITHDNEGQISAKGSI